MIAETVSVGTELLLGQIVDTNAAYLARVLSGLGISLFFRSTVGDNSDRMREALRLALSRSDLVITIGGLGPTQDDLTKEILCEVMGVELTMDPIEEEKLRAFLTQRGVTYPASVLKQALVPKTDGQGLPNPMGTAPGIVVEKDGRIGICLPGPPNELIPMTEQSVIPYLSEKTFGERAVIMSRTLRIIDLGESAVEERVKDLTNDTNPTVAPYAKTGEVHLRVTASAGNEMEAEAIIEQRVTALRGRLWDVVYGYDDETLEYAVVQMLKLQGKTIATAESCTGGLLAQRITSISGASEVFHCGVVTYGNNAKTKLLYVPQEMLLEHGAVSEQVAKAMSLGAQVQFGADVGIGITGIAGPNGGSSEKPVGLVYIALARLGRVIVERHQYSGSRSDVTQRASQSALALLRRELLSGQPAFPKM